MTENIAGSAGAASNLSSYRAVRREMKDRATSKSSSHWGFFLLTFLRMLVEDGWKEETAKENEGLFQQTMLR